MIVSVVASVILLLLSEALELKLLLGIGGEGWILMQLLQHLLVKGLGKQPVCRLLLHHLCPG